ncbi:iron donor protein CyaY [Haliangium sp.]|uniref:iron donor protein CyaY n=1 Tax=Haliangium sp. TaxID=2663208 RepID=UPI003D122E9B
MDEATFDELARAELRDLEEKFLDVDPDEVEATGTDGVLELALKDGVRIIINTQRPTRQLWMAAVANAWRFDYDRDERLWRTARGAELRSTLAGVIADRIGLAVAL